MKAMILAAGLGTRMRPLTLETPKPLLSAGGKPLVVWHIEALKKAGITEIVINCAWLADKLMGSIGDGSRYGVNIHWSVEAEALETAGGIAKALPILGSEPFLVINGDVWTRYDYAELVDQFATNSISNKDLAHLVMVGNPEQHQQGDFVFAGHRLYLNQLDVDASLRDQAEKLTFSGISILSPQLFSGLPSGKQPLAPLLRAAIENGLVSASKISCAWVDVGTPERLRVLDQQIADLSI